MINQSTIDCLPACLPACLTCPNLVRLTPVGPSLPPPPYARAHTGCFFRERNNTLSSFLEEVEKAIENPDVRSRQFGQMILVLGGTLHLNGCKCR